MALPFCSNVAYHEGVTTPHRGIFDRAAVMSGAKHTSETHGNRSMSGWAWRSKLGRAMVILAVAVTYFVAARVGLALSLAGTNATPVWPSSGIAMAALLALGWRAWPGVLLGAWAANAIQFAGMGTLPVTHVVLGSVMVAGGNTLEALAGRAILVKSGMAARPFDRVGDAFKFVFTAMTVPAIAATVGLLAILSLGASAGVNPLDIWVTWWLGDAAGILVYAPALLAWTWRWQSWTRARWAELAILGLSLVPTGFLLFAWLPDPMVRSLPYLVMPLLLWVVLRFSLREAASAVVVVTAIATWGTMRSRGPFVAETLNESLLLLQSFVGTVAVTVLALSAAITERRHVYDALLEANRTLEERVRDRTSQLSEVNEHLTNEVRERRHAEEVVRHLAQHDSLTGLANRRLLEGLFDSVEALARRRGSGMALLFLDLDDFKPINDTLGHGAGDEVLVQVAARLQGAVRESDLVARVGGDEFVVVLPELGRPEDATAVADKILRAVTVPLRLRGQDRELGISIGIARYPQDARDLQGLLRCADRAMYRVKSGGKNGYALFDDGSGRESELRSRV
jgi:diguanylate cyclase (GGDEF)-like protein